MSRIAMFLGVLIAFIPAAALAEKTITSPYEACKGITIKSVSKDSVKDAVPCDTCTTQAAPDIMRIANSLESTAFATMGYSFLSQVAEEVRNTIRKTVGQYSELKACFDNQSTKECQDKVADFKKQIEIGMQQQHEHLLLMNTLAAGTFGNQSKSTNYLFPKVRAKQFQGEPVSEETRARLNNQIEDAVNLVKGSCAAEQIPTPACHNKIDAELAKMGKQTQDKLIDLKWAQMPILVTLGAGITGKKDYRNDKVISKAIGELIEAGQNQIAIAEKSVAAGKMDKVHSGQDRDLTDYMAFGKAVETVLKRHPGYCGIASTLSEHMELRMMPRYGLIGVGTLAGFFMGNKAGAAMQMGKMANNALQLAGLGMGYGFIGVSAFDTISAKEATLTGAADYAYFKQKLDNLKFNIALHPLDYIGVGAAGKAAGKIAKNFAAAGEQMKADGKALSGARGVFEQLIMSLKDEKVAAKLASSDNGYKNSLLSFFRKKGLKDKDAKQVAACFDGSGKCSPAARKLLASIGENDALAGKTAGLEGKVAVNVGASEKGVVSAARNEVKDVAKTVDNAIPASAVDEAIDFSKIKTDYLTDDLRKGLAKKYGKPGSKKSYFEKIRAAFLEDENFRNLCKLGAKSCNEQDDIVYHLFNKMEKQGAGRNEKQVKAEIEKILNSCGWKG